MIDAKRLTETFLELLEIDSPSGREAAAAADSCRRLTALGAEVSFDSASSVVEGDCSNLIARFSTPHTVLEAPPVLLSAHLDTVSAGTGIQAVQEGDIVRSDGTTILGGDDKAGIAIILEVLTAAVQQELALPPLEIILTVSEERGILGALALDPSSIKSRRGIVFDASGPAGNIVIRAPYQNSISCLFTGRAAHAGIEPENGNSAILLAAKALGRMRLGRIDSETTANMGTVSGGTADNIVPGECLLTGEARSMNENQLEKITAEIKEACVGAARARRGTAQVTVKRKYDGYAIPPTSRTLRLLEEAFRQTGLQPRHIELGGGSDANAFCAMGIDCLNIAFGGWNFHSTREYVSLSEMEKTARAVVAFLRLAIADS
jgi:tripeptide aminopeptidase